jgi:hypothetical protein
MAKLLRKIIDKDDLAVMGITACLTLMGTGIFAALANTKDVGDAVEISAPIAWSDSYSSALKTFGEVAMYSLPISITVGYISSKVLKRV